MLVSSDSLVTSVAGVFRLRHLSTLQFIVGKFLTPAIRCANREFLLRLERVMGIEPTLPAWKAGALPLSYTRNAHTLYTTVLLNTQGDRVVEGVGFEPT